MAVTWTEEQQQVIDRRGCNILVSAAAGSGKTAVLVERILALITDEKRPVDIDRLLVVTFTNAAAGEMRERIRDALEQRAEAEPDNVHLQRQLVLVHNAKITTIHSFCLHVLRNHFQTVGIDPSFRVADEGEILLLEQETARETVDAAYETGDQEFISFLEVFTTGKSDRAVEEAVLRLYHFALGQPWPSEWLERCRTAYGFREEAAGLEALPWLQFITGETGRLLQDIEGQVKAALEIAHEPDGPYPYIKALESDLELVRHLERQETYDDYAAAFYAMHPFARLGTKRDGNISEQKKQQVQAIRGDVKDRLADIRKRYYFDRPEILREELEESGLTVRVLTRLTEQFMNRLAEKKAEKNILDYGDLEHLALEALVEHREEDAPTAVAREYAESFEEIMIDEYQDSNLVQELILSSVSGRGREDSNMFMVGDVKQSIYRFRLARPELFLEKYRTYRERGEKACRIDLRKNFRSRPEVLEGINFIFRQIMTENPGQIVYDEDAALYPGAEFGECDNPDFRPTELWLLETEGRERIREEARLAGRRIREIVGTEHVWDREEGCSRPVRYGDIVILLRTVTGWADTFGEVFSEMGIPCYTGSQRGYFSALEIRTVLSYLQILDNPMQDIPLAAVLRSPMGRLTDDELAQIRAFSRRHFFYDCVQEYRQEGSNGELREKLERFFAVYQGLRAKCDHTPVHLLLWELLDVTGYGDYARALPAGSQRKANLDMLVEKAIAYEATSYRGLYHFVRYIENLKKYEVDYGEANTEAEGADTVRIMSIHKSKGLEFSVVFVCGLGKQFNESDIRSRLVMHPEFGIGCDFVDPGLRTRRATLLKRAIQQKTDSENLGEELRVLYVAMTRAREKLILTGAAADLETAVRRWRQAAAETGGQLSYAWLSSASTCLDWIVPPLLRHPSSHHLLEELDPEGAEKNRVMAKGAETAPFVVRAAVPEEALKEEFLEENSSALRLEELLRPDLNREYDRETGEYLRHVFSAVYPYGEDRRIVGKVSVSDLKKASRLPEEEGEELYREETVIPLIPGFRGGTAKINGAARGTAVHTFMENLDFSKKDGLQLQLEELISCGKMSQEEADAVCLKEIRQFLETELGRRMESAALAGRLYREQPFVLGVPANQVQADWNPQETVLVQGIIDAYFQEGDTIVLVDYKTDRAASPQVLAEKYRLQLDCYAAALERLTCLPVRERLIYSFCLGQEIRLG